MDLESPNFDPRRQDCLMMLFPFLETVDYYKMAVLDKEMSQVTKNVFFWKKLFKTEFHYEAEKFKDVEITENESPRDLFIKSFKLYQTIRRLLKRMLVETARQKSAIYDETPENCPQSTQLKNDYLRYLKPFNSRRLSPFIENLQNITLEYVCFHKNWNDLANFTEIEGCMEKYGGFIYNKLENFKFLEVEYYGQVFEQIMLSAPTVAILQMLSIEYKNIQPLPFIHIMRCPGVIVQDFGNHYGNGSRSLVYLALDRRKSMIMASSIEQFLERHVQRLESNWFNNLRGNLEAYALNPTDAGAYGSSTTTRGVRITAHAFYNHLVSRFDSADDPSDQDTYLFSYQIRIWVVDNSEDENVSEEEKFADCVLTTRTWHIDKGNGEIDTVDNQPGVIGYYPTMTREKTEQKCFIYESQCFTHGTTGTKMSGWFTFRILNGPKKDQEFNAIIAPFELKVPEEYQVVKTPEFYSPKEDN